MKRLFYFSILILQLVSLPACSIYRSADRAEFESDAPSIRIKSVQKISCSRQSVALQASQSRLVTTVADEFVWEHRLDSQSIYESTNLKGTYCLYDIEFE